MRGQESGIHLVLKSTEIVKLTWCANYSAYVILDLYIRVASFGQSHHRKKYGYSFFFPRVEEMASNVTNC